MRIDSCFDPYPERPRQPFEGHTAKVPFRESGAELGFRDPRRVRTADEPDPPFRGPAPGAGPCRSYGVAMTFHHSAQRTDSPPVQPGSTGPASTVQADPYEAGPVRTSYAPDRDGDPDPGEIVWTWVPFEENERRLCV